VLAFLATLVGSLRSLQHPPDQLEAVAVSGRALYRSPRSKSRSEATSALLQEVFLLSANRANYIAKCNKDPSWQTSPCNSLPATINTQPHRASLEVSFMVANSRRVCVDDRRGLRRARLLTGWLPRVECSREAARTPNQRPQSRQMGWWSMPALRLAASQSHRESESHPSPGPQR